MKRRQFAFWVGFGLFNLAEKLRANSLDRLAAATMRLTDSKAEPSTEAPSITEAKAEHWSAAENKTWRWLERENLVDGKWKLTGITTPVHKQTGERYTGKTGYLDERLAPEDVRFGEQEGSEEEVGEIEPAPHLPDSVRRARHGRPPSRWLRSLNADELRVWLKTIDVPEAGVSGMTYWIHLTRDHSFNPKRIDGLAENEQAKLHAAAHYGY